MDPGGPAGERKTCKCAEGSIRFQCVFIWTEKNAASALFLAQTCLALPGVEENRPFYFKPDLHIVSSRLKSPVRKTRLPCSCRISGNWFWAGHSNMAFNPATRLQGPFDGHVNGNLVMKELTLPWNNWHSSAASIDADVLSPDDPLQNYPHFVNKVGMLLKPTSSTISRLPWSLLHLTVKSVDNEVNGPSLTESSCVAVWHGIPLAHRSPNGPASPNVKL
jgi:hypothetical protein